MAVYAQFDEIGLPTAFYNTDVNDSIPTDVTYISDQVWQEFINNPGRRIWRDGHIQQFDPEPIVDQATVVSDRQFIQALAEDSAYKTISWDEAIAWGSNGTLPKLLTDSIVNIPDEATRNRTLMLLKSAKTYELNHPASQQLAMLLGWDEARLKGLWNFASTL